MLCSESGLAHVRWREKQMNILVCDDNENAVNTITTMLQTRCQENAFRPNYIHIRSLNV